MATESQHDLPDREDEEPARWNTDPLLDTPVGPDDAGNGVMFAMNAIVAVGRWVRSRVRGLFHRDR